VSGPRRTTPTGAATRGAPAAAGAAARRPGRAGRDGRAVHAGGGGPGGRRAGRARSGTVTSSRRPPARGEHRTAVLEGAAAGRVVGELVEARRRGRQEHGGDRPGRRTVQQLARDRRGPREGGGQRAGLLDEGNARGAEERGQLGAALPDEDCRGGALGGDPAQRRQVDALVAAARDEDDGRLEAPQGRRDGVGLGPLRVVDVADSVELRHELEAVLHAPEARGLAPDGVGCDAEEECRPGCREEVREVVASWESELADRQDPSARSRGRGSASGQGQPLHARRHDPPVRDPEPPWDRAIEAVADRGRRTQAGVPPTTGSSRLSTRAPSGSTSSARRRLTRRYPSREPWRSRWSAVTLV
jgi:hypothetical protein